jgi:hypothetical protein
MNDTNITTKIEIIIETLDFMFADFSDLSSSEKFVERILECRRLYLKNGLCDELDYLLESVRELVDEDFISLEEFNVINNFITAHD